MRVIDLRSDTLTKPSAEMRAAMASAEVGDDVYGEDPSLNRLQAVAAERLGKEAALFVPSGTMANQIALRAHTRPGDALIASRHAHVHEYEAGGAAALSGVHSVLVGTDGFFGADEVRAAILPNDDHYPRTRLICVENTHNRSGGRVFPEALVQEIRAVASEHDLALHLDGARVFNAALASGREVAELAQPFDSVAFCLSKGLGAPVGSLLCGGRPFIQQARRIRKMLGGGMRQAGVLGAAGLHALEHNVTRLAHDHEHARLLANGVAGHPHLKLLCEPETNMVLFGVRDAAGAQRRLRELGLWMGTIDPQTLRAVTHLDIGQEDIESAIERLQRFVG